MLALTPLIQHKTGNFSQCNKARQENKKHPNWKGINKTVSIYMTVYKENLKRGGKSISYNEQVRSARSQDRRKLHKNK